MQSGHEGQMARAMDQQNRGREGSVLPLQLRQKPKGLIPLWSSRTNPYTTENYQSGLTQLNTAHLGGTPKGHIPGSVIIHHPSLGPSAWIPLDDKS